VPGRSSRGSSAPLNVVQVAELLGYLRAHVHDLRESGDLPHFRESNNSLRFACKALGRVLRVRRSPGTTNEKA